MFCVVYRFHVRQDKEEQFQAGWKELTEILKEQNGALGSRLHRDSNSDWIAYAQWPDEQTWSSCSNTSVEAVSARKLMFDSKVEEKETEVLFKLNVLHDLLTK